MSVEVESATLPTATTTTNNNNDAKKKKKKPPPPLYQENAVKYFNGFMCDKRYKKGIQLSTACAIFKTAWELPDNNGMVLTNRVIRHFKQVLPKKPKPTATATTAAPTKTITKPTKQPATTSAADDNNASMNMRARTMVDRGQIPNDLLDLATADNQHLQYPQYHEQRRTMVAFSSAALAQTAMKVGKVPLSSIHAGGGVKSDADEAKMPMESIEHMIEETNFDEQELDEMPPNLKASHIAKSASMGDVLRGANLDDHDHDEEQQDQQQRVANLKEAQNVKFQQPKSQDHESDTKQQDEDAKGATEAENDKNDVETALTKTEKETNPKPKKTVPPKSQILYSEDAIKLFKKINDNKRFKNGLMLSKTCALFNVAWEVPEQNGVILTSKVQRHFKQALPSKKTAKKTVTNKKPEHKKKDSNIKPSMVSKAKTQRDYHTASVNVENENEEKFENAADLEMATNQNNENDALPTQEPVVPYAAQSHSRLMSMRTVLLPGRGMSAMTAGVGGPKKNAVSTLEAMMAADPHRSNDNDSDKFPMRNQRAESMMTLALGALHDDHSEDVPEDEVVEENDIEELYKLKKKEAESAEKEKQQMESAIDKSLGL